VFIRLLRHATLLAGCLAAAAAACRPHVPDVTDDAGPAPVDSGPARLPTGARLDPAGPAVDVMPLPLALLPSPEGDAVVLLASGWRAQGVQVLDRATGRVRQTLPQASAFVGLAFAPDGRTLWASGGNEDLVYRYRWAGGRATLADSVRLGAPPSADSAGRPARRAGVRYPAGLAPSRDGRWLYVAENLGDSLAVVDAASGRVVQRLATERYPYGVAVGPDGTVYASAWGGRTVSVFTATGDAARPLAAAARIPVARHPSALLLNGAGTRLFVASGSTDRVDVVDTRARRVLTALHDPPPGGPQEGSTPNALALSPDGARLYVAEGDANAVAVFALDSATADAAPGRPAPRGGDRLVGRVPAGWYPSALLAAGDSLYVANGKGRGTRPNPDGPQPRSSAQAQRQGPARGDRSGPDTSYTLGQIGGTVMTFAFGALGDDALAPLTARVARANGWDAPAGSRQAAARPAYPPIRHVVYVVKENRTYDQILGDLAQADGDTSLLFFGRAVTPNHHALAERFGVYDRFFVNAEASPDGHNWSMAAYTTDYLQKTVPSNYSGRGRSYDYEGTNRGAGADAIPEDDVAEPANGYLWNLVQARGLTFRNYGEFVVPPDAKGPLPAGYRGNKPFLEAHTNPAFPGYDLAVPDQRRADVWIAELGEFVRRGAMPALSIVRLPNDHTAGARLGAPTPRAYMADNDLALGRMVEALSRTPFWRETAVFVLEDDAQNGPDHVDSHRSPLLVVSPWSRPGVHHRFANTTDVLATIEELLGLGAMSQFDHYGRPLRDIWAATPDLRPYTALRPAVPLEERNTAANTHPADRRASARLALEVEDQADELTFNRVLWRTIRGAHVPYPGARRLSGQELRLAGVAR
jgi:DNA-binding beta-propeller fold protein YncE